MTDFRFVLRILRRSPAFFVVATATLGLGIAANTAMFSLFYQVLLRTLPVPDPRSLVVFHSDPPNLPGGVSSDNGETVFSYPMYQRLRDGLRAFQGVAARSGDSVQIGVDGAADRGRAEFVSGNFFDTLQVRSQIGRLLTPSDDTAPGANTVAVISHDFWERRFGLHASALNRTILLNGHAFTIVGVAQAGFRGVLAGDTPDLFVPISAKLLLAPNWTSYDKPDMQWLTVLGRLAPGMSRERASAELQPVFAAVMRDHIQQAGVKGQSARSRLLAKHAELRPAAQGLNQLEQQWKNPLFVLLGMASLLLLIACANLANLLAARASNRAREIGVRIALGATRGRIVRLLLIESGILALTGTVLGIAFAPVLNRMLLQISAGGRTGRLGVKRAEPAGSGLLSGADDGSSGAMRSGSGHPGYAIGLTSVGRARQFRRPCFGWNPQAAGCRTDCAVIDIAGLRGSIFAQSLEPDREQFWIPCGAGADVLCERRDERL